MASLLPTNADPLIRQFENVDGSAIISTVGFTALSWSWDSVPPLPDGVNVNPDGSTLVVDWSLVPGLFPINFVKYLDEEIAEQTVFDLEDVPDGQRITEYRADTTNKREYVFTVTGTGVDSMAAPASATVAYLIQILQNYSTTRDRLQEKIDGATG